MELKEYLFRNNMTALELANSLEVNPAYLRMIKRKVAYPSKKLSLKIEIITGGQVTFKELRYKDAEI